MTSALLRHGSKWEADEQRRLYDAFTNGLSIENCAQNFQRSEAAIRHMLRRLGLISAFGEPVHPCPEFECFVRKPGGAEKKVSFPTAQDKFIDESWKEKILEEVYSTSTLQELHESGLLDVRAYNALHLHEFKTAADLLAVEDQALMRLQNFGRKSLRQIQRIKDYLNTNLGSGKKQQPNESAAARQKPIPPSLQNKQKLSIETEDVREDIDFVASIVDRIGPDIRAKRILKARLGVCPEQAVLNLRVLADEFGVSRERIRQIESRMLQRVRGYIRRHYDVHLRYSELFDDEECSGFLELQDIMYDIIGSQAFNIIVKLIYCFDFNLKNLPQIKGLAESALRPYFAKLKRQAEEDRERKLTWRQQFISSQLMQSIQDHKTATSDSLDAWIKDAREVNQSEFSGTILSKKAGKEIQFESRTELKILKTLEKMPEVSWYDVQCIQFPYKFKGKQLTYHPDIICKIVDGRIVVIEVKPMLTIALLAAFRKAVVARQKCERNGWHYIFLSPPEGAIENMACWEGAKEIEKELVNLIGNKLISNYEGINWKEIKSFMKKHNLDSRDMTAIALRNDLAFTQHPYLCGKLPDGYSWSVFIPALLSDRDSLNRNSIFAKKRTLTPNAVSDLEED